MELITKKQAIEAIDEIESEIAEGFGFEYEKWRKYFCDLPPAQPEQLEQCPIYGGMCAYPSDQCYDCPRHAGAKMGVTT